MTKVTIAGIIKTSIVTAFTIAAALIWKDIIMEVIISFVPAEEQFLYKVLVAVIATVIIVLVIWRILQAQKETEVILKKYKDKKHQQEIEEKKIKKWRKRLEKEKKRRRQLKKKMKKLRAMKRK